jgi:hypothetical protein
MTIAIMANISALPKRDIVSDADLVIYLGDRRSKNLATSAALA